MWPVFNSSIDWSAVIVDEAHKIKNPNSQITGAMKELRCLVRVGLTGTILQNNLDELWCVMDWWVYTGNITTTVSITAATVRLITLI